MDLEKETERILLEIRAERMRRRVAQGVVHRTPDCWVARLNRACDDADEDLRNKEDPNHYRAHLVEVAAIAAEALEDFDRDREKTMRTWLSQRRTDAARTHH